MSGRYERNPDTITMYGADWCGDCIRAKAFFNENNIDFDYVDLVELPDETEVVLERNGGVQKIPVIIFPDGSHLTEPSNEELEAKTRSSRLVENVDAGRFELHIDRELVSFANYSEREGIVTIPHVETNPAHRGQGNAGRLMDEVLARLEKTGRKVVPLCPFARQHVYANEAHLRLLAPTQ